MSSQPFMQLYVADYLADTLDLTAEQHGAYLLLLMTMWRHDARLPNDPSKLARIARVSPRRWHQIWAAIGRFFFTDGDQIGNERLDREYQKAVSISQKRSVSGAKGGAAKALNNKAQDVASASVLPKHSQISDIREEKNTPSGADKPAVESMEVLLFRFGKDVLGKSAGGVITRLRKACRYDDAEAMKHLEQARLKQSPIEWINAAIKRLENPPKTRWQDEPEYRGVRSMA